MLQSAPTSCCVHWRAATCENNYSDGRQLNSNDGNRNEIGMAHGEENQKERRMCPVLIGNGGANAAMKWSHVTINQRPRERDDKEPTGGQSKEVHCVVSNSCEQSPAADGNESIFILCNGRLCTSVSADHPFWRFIHLSHT